MKVRFPLLWCDACGISARSARARCRRRHRQRGDPCCEGRCDGRCIGPHAANFEAGRRAAAEGVELEWREADAEAPPFDDKKFDVVTSCLWRDVHSEPPRCRQRASARLSSWWHDWHGELHTRLSCGDFFDVLGRYAPPLPPGALPPVLWGREVHVRDLFGSQLASLEMTRRTYVETAPSARDYCELFRQTFGFMIAIRAGLADQPERLAALDRDFMEFVTRSNRGTTADRVKIPYGYLLVVARRRAEPRR